MDGRRDAILSAVSLLPSVSTLVNACSAIIHNIKGCAESQIYIGKRGLQPALHPCPYKNGPDSFLWSFKGGDILITAPEGNDPTPGILENNHPYGRAGPKIPFLILFPGPIPERVLIQYLIRVPGSIINLPFPVLKINAAQPAVPCPGNHSEGG